MENKSNTNPRTERKRHIISDGFYIYRDKSKIKIAHLDESNIKIDPERKKRITLGAYIYLIGEIAFLLVVLYAIFK